MTFPYRSAFLQHVSNATQCERFLALSKFDSLRRRSAIDSDINCGQIVFQKNPFLLTGMHTRSI